MAVIVVSTSVLLLFFSIFNCNNWTEVLQIISVEGVPMSDEQIFVNYLYCSFSWIQLSVFCCGCCCICANWVIPHTQCCAPIMPPTSSLSVHVARETSTFACQNPCRSHVSFALMATRICEYHLQYTFHWAKSMFLYRRCIIKISPSDMPLMMSSRITAAICNNSLLRWVFFFFYYFCGYTTSSRHGTGPSLKQKNEAIFYG